MPKVPDCSQRFVTDKAGNTYPVSTDGTPIYKQWDLKWAKDKLGESRTIGGVGCAMVATAMALSKISGETIAPAELNEYLMEHSGYKVNDLRWDMAAQRVGMGSERLGAIDVNILNEQIEAGRPVVIGTNKDGHFVAVTRKKGDNTYYANDPLTGKEIKMTLENGKLSGGAWTSSGTMVYFTGEPNTGTA